MSHGHGPESGSHNDDPELLAERYDAPDRIPYDGPPHPEVQYTVIDQDDFTTTHKDFLNRWYQIKNGSMQEAKDRVKIEKARNKRLKEANVGDSQGNGLFRINAAGAPIRAATSTNELFLNAVAASGTENTPANYDIGKPGAFITYGMGENGSNEMAALSQRSPSIVVSALERDRALAAGKSLEDAQQIGAIAYREQEIFREFNDHHDQQPEASSVTFVQGDAENEQPPVAPTTPSPNPIEAGTAPQGPTPDSDAEPISLATQGELPKPKQESERLNSKEKLELTKKWFRKIGRDATLAIKTVRGIGAVDTAHFGLHKVADGLSPALEKSQKILESIQNSPDSVSKEFRAAKDTIKLTAKLLKIIWSERQLEARKRKSIKYQDRLNAKSVDQKIVDERIAKIFTYLGQKHPEVVLYSLYNSTPEN